MIFPIRSTGVPRSLPPLQGAGLGFGKGREGLLSKPMPIWRLEKLRYMHRDPVKRGLVGEPEQWRWSSYRSHAFGEAGLVRIYDCDVLVMRFGGVMHAPGIGVNLWSQACYRI